MKRIVLFAVMILLVVGCGPKKEKLEFGEIVPTREGFLLPIQRSPESKRIDYTVELAFSENAAILYSKREMHSCFLTFAYSIPETGGQDISTLDLDFHDRIDGIWVYRAPYPLFPARKILDNVIQTAVYYAPEGVGLPQKEVKDKDGGRLFYPDYKGYFFIFNREETLNWFKPALDHIK